MATANERDRPPRRVVRGVRVVLCGLAAVHLVQALLLRRRCRRLVALPEGGDEVMGVLPPVDVVATAGVDVDAVTLGAVGRELEASGAEAVDLVPGDLPVPRSLSLLRRVDPERLARDPLYLPGGAHEALVRQPSLAQRMRKGDGGHGGHTGRGGSAPGPQDRGQMVRETMAVQRYAPAATRVRVAPRLSAGPGDPDERWRELEALTAAGEPYVRVAPILVGAETAHLLLLSAGWFVAPAAAAAALAAWSIQPVLVFAGRGDPGPSGLRPRHLTRSSLLRLPGAWRDNIRLVAAAYRSTRAQKRAQTGAKAPVAPPEDVLFEPVLTDCPWCGSDSLVRLVEASDVLLSKPGTFHLDECRSCGHVFQNPALTDLGLDYYYDQAYDGLGEAAADAGFRSVGTVYRRRIEAVGQFTEPRAWLDVGTGHGHFCLTARQRWPGARFDGLDRGEAVDEATRRGWIDDAFRGRFPDLADGLPRSYDVVSMHQYLEHTREPRLELSAAAKVLAPGGYLMVEVPDPESPWGRRLGRYWFNWLQPQHLHFVTCGNLVEALGDLGFEVVSVERSGGAPGPDLLGAVGVALARSAPSPHFPWNPATSTGYRVRRAALVAAAAPALLVAGLGDVVKDVGRGSEAPGNSYRVVARRR